MCLDIFQYGKAESSAQSLVTGQNLSVLLSLSWTGTEDSPPTRRADSKLLCSKSQNNKKYFILFIIYLFFLVLPLYCYQPISFHPHAHMLSHVIQWTSACQAPLSMDFSRQEYWSGLPFPSPTKKILNLQPLRTFQPLKMPRNVLKF